MINSQERKTMIQKKTENKKKLLSKGFRKYLRIEIGKARKISDTEEREQTLENLLNNRKSK